MQVIAVSCAGCFTGKKIDSGMNGIGGQCEQTVKRALSSFAQHQSPTS